MPHLSARLVVDRSHLEELVARIAEMGVRDVFVVAGDADRARRVRSAGRQQLLDAMAELGHPFEQIGITGYPESHPIIDDETTIAAMFEKARHATYIASQICFDSRVTVAWIDNVWARGTRLPIFVGIPGIVPRAKLAARLDEDRDRRVAPLPAQARRLRDAVPAARRLQPRQADQGARAGARRRPSSKVAGFHIFTFNDLADTEAWRQRTLAGG